MTSWPATLSPAALEAIGTPTPYLVTDLGTVADRHAAFRAAMPDVRVHYAMKCNPAPEILRTLHAEGAGFEIASLGELRMLEAVGVDPADVLYSNPVKPPAHIAAAHAAGLWRFSFDSPNELVKIAEHAPGAAVYVRLRVDDQASVFPLSRKFGTDVEDAYDLLLLAERLGLRPYGITFHVGSQCVRPDAWAEAVDVAGKLMDRLRHDNIELEMLDLGGGFPARYTTDVPAIEEIAKYTNEALDDLPYRPALIVAEPGRHLVAESGVLAATVIGHERRGDENWLYIEVGAYNGLMEVLQTPGGWDFPIQTRKAAPSTAPAASGSSSAPGSSGASSSSSASGSVGKSGSSSASGSLGKSGSSSAPGSSSTSDSLGKSGSFDAAADLIPYTITGPSCDSTDTIAYGVLLPADLTTGDVLYLGSTGGYTLAYASNFNGFDPPTPLFTGARD
ncbi:type III PLP-dependent enzyme [Actinoplanes sp. LDG1-06]|uniref:ornithine decarboxylase n=1 Tax=Paractinoplanes ovalisporus TaxID=2810368 RepID=A0ABS2AS20_9ACTN|nr:type III PLP-dependent enzyme [Actinoplanes ovalisporus]MBM2621949.1 type III PLP-dependent enzyme [Actinoplanes ovalisporus]